MSTRCYVMVKDGETVNFNYIHNDGYIKRGVGQKLIEEFNSPGLALTAVKVGHRSTLESEKPYDDCDGDETKFDISEIEDFIRECETIEFFYLWDDGIWKVREASEKEFKPLSELL